MTQGRNAVPSSLSWVRYARQARDYIKLAVGNDQSVDRLLALEDAEQRLKMAIADLKVKRAQFAAREEQRAEERANG